MVGLLRLAPGAVFAGDFEVRELLARGGMGTVYAVFDRRSGEPRALKVLLPELVADEDSRRRFAQEAKVVADVDSPYLPRVYRAGIDEPTGVPYIAMDLLEGRDLRRAVTESGPLPIDEARRVLEQLGHALAAAHRIGLVHRDLKPENVFLDASVTPSEVRLLDFGVSKVLDAHRTSATGTAAVGSPMWMAPEQTSAGGRISPATDVWALGLVTFFVLTGKLFWKAAQEHSGVAGLLRELHVDAIEAASARAAWLGVEGALPAGFDAWFARAVARDPQARFRDADEAMAALREVLPAPAPRGRDAMAFAETLAVDRSEIRTGPMGGWPADEAKRTAPMGSVQAEPARDFATLRDGLPAAPAFGRAPEGGGRAAEEPPPLSPPPIEPADWAAPSAGPPPSDPSRPSYGSGPSSDPSRPSFGSAPPPSEPSGAAWSTPASSGGATPSWSGADIPRTDPPPPMTAARRTSPLVWVALVLLAGLAVSILSAVIVWVALTLGDARDAEPPAPAPSPPTPAVDPSLPVHPEPMQPIEVGSTDGPDAP